MLRKILNTLSLIITTMSNAGRIERHAYLVASRSRRVKVS